jgi:beta-lactamase class D
MNFRVSQLVMLAGVLGCSPTAAPEREPPASTAPASASRDSVSVEEVDLSAAFGGIAGAFAVLDPKAGRLLVHNPERARTRFTPASTFKIPNTLIALESGVASGPDFRLQWDSTVAPRQPWWPAEWARDHTLRSALRASAVWYYQEIARRVGSARMQQYVDRFDYGNRDISGGIDQFWLDGELRISPMEQVDFLRRFHAGELGVSDRATRIVKDVLVLEATPTYRLSGKTGWAGIGDSGVGWLVGYLERGDDVYFFATNIPIRRNQDAAERLPITKASLRELGLMPADARD